MSKFSPLAMIKQQQEENKYRTQVLDLREVQTHPKNDFPITSSDINALAESIQKSGGILQFPLVRLLSDGSFQMLAGHRRQRASILLGETVDEKYFRTMCYVLEDISDERAELFLIDTNIQARDLTPKMRAQKISEARKLIETLKERGEIEAASIKRAVSEHTGVSESMVILQTRIAEKLIPELMELYDKGDFGVREAYEYSGLTKKSQLMVRDAYVRSVSQEDLRTEILRIIQDEKLRTGKQDPKQKEVHKKVNQVKKRLNDMAALKEEGISIDRELLEDLRSIIDRLLKG